MASLEELARAVVEEWETGNLAEAVHNLADYLKEQDALRETYADEIAEAREWEDIDDIWVDDPPLVSAGDEGGFWVGAWIWTQIPQEK